MDVSSIAAAASANAAAKVQAEASVKVLKMALDMQAESALQLLQAIPAPVQPPVSAVGSAAGGVVDTWA
ncbi:YjfB family protein [Thauera butanivorans]|uniref:YjfB family protein n=1 Tax=Thauera butanivorans TaxID=86174 RepID=UPI000838BD6F|nr:YjfB family protein [Thauera butanivorans]